MSYTTECPAGSDLVQKYSSLIQGKVVLVTGTSPHSIGGAYVEAVAVGNPKLLIVAGRSGTKINQTIEDASKSVGNKTEFRPLLFDFGSFADVRRAAAEVNSWTDVPHIDVLVNNAGIMATPYKKNVDGIENQLAVNHLGPFLFTSLIIDKLLASPEPRVVTVTSDGHRLGPIRWDDYNFDKEGSVYNAWAAYGQSKTGNMLMTLSLAEKYGRQGLLAYSVHPGLISTNLSSHLDLSEGVDSDLVSLRNEDRKLGNKYGWHPMLLYTMDQAIATHVFASFAPELKDYNGAYLIDGRLSDPYCDTVKPWATDSTEAERLWRLSKQLVGLA